MSALVAAYSTGLSRFPALTKYCTTFWICCASVFMSQRCVWRPVLCRLLLLLLAAAKPLTSSSPAQDLWDHGHQADRVVFSSSGGATL